MSRTGYGWVPCRVATGPTHQLKPIHVGSDGGKFDANKVSTLGPTTRRILEKKSGPIRVSTWMTVKESSITKCNNDMIKGGALCLYEELQRVNHL